MYVNNLTPTYSISAGGYTAVIASFGGGLKDLRFQGRPLTETYTGYPPLSAGVVLAPWPNRTEDGRYQWQGDEFQLPVNEVARHNAIHGLVYDKVWECVEHRDDTVTLAVNIPPQAGYPWFVRLVTAYRLDETGLTAQFSASSPHENVPYAFGWHTYLSAGGADLDDCRLDLDVCQHVELDANRLLPTGKVGAPCEFGQLVGREFDHCFAGFHGATLTGPDLHVRMECSRDIRWAQVFTPRDYPGRGRALAVEPMSAPPNALRSGDGLRTLPVTDTVRISATERQTDGHN